MVLMVLGASACTYQTDQVYQAGLGVNNRSGTVDILGAVVVSGTDGSGTFVASLVNKDLKNTATLTSVTGASGLTIQLTKQVQVGPESLVNLADLGAISVAGNTVTAGGYVELTLQFDTGQKSVVNAPVVTRDGEYSQVQPAIPGASPSS